MAVQPKTSRNAGTGSEEIFHDPDIERTRSEDPLFRFVFKYWQQILYAVIGVGIVSYVYNGYRRTQETNLARSAELLYKVQEALEGYESKSGSQTESAKEARELLEQRITAFNDVNKKPYDQIAALYSAIADIKEKKYSAAVDQLREGADFSKVSAGSSERLFPELHALVLARALLEQDQTVEEGKQILHRLAREGEYVMASAAVAYARLAQTPDAKSEALALLKSVRERKPEQSDLLRDEIARLS